MSSAAERMFNTRIPTIPEHVLHPPGLRPSRPELEIVCGPPCAGKSTYVRERAQLGDVVIDLDDILDGLLRRSGARVPGRIQGLQRALVERNRILACLAESAAPRAWSIVGAPAAADRTWREEQLGAARVTVLATPAAIALERLNADPLRYWIRKQQAGAIARWWAEFEATAGGLSTKA